MRRDLVVGNILIDNQFNSGGGREVDVDAKQSKEPQQSMTDNKTHWSLVFMYISLPQPNQASSKPSHLG